MWVRSWFRGVVSCVGVFLQIALPHPPRLSGTGGLKTFLGSKLTHFLAYHTAVMTKKLGGGKRTGFVFVFARCFENQILGLVGKHQHGVVPDGNGGGTCTPYVGTPRRKMNGEPGASFPCMGGVGLSHSTNITTHGCILLSYLSYHAPLCPVFLRAGDQA